MSDSPSDIARSREYEMKTYVNSMHAIYENAVLQNGEIFDIASAETRAFTQITPAAIISDSRIIKILRYCLAPSISQIQNLHALKTAGAAIVWEHRLTDLAEVLR